MSRRRPLTSSLSDALRAAGIDRKEVFEPCKAESRASIPSKLSALEALRVALSEVVSIGDVVRCAVVAGRLGLYARPTTAQKRAAYAAIEAAGRLAAGSGTATDEVAGLVLALACLSRHSRSAKMKVAGLVAQIIVRRGLDVNWLDQIAGTVQQRALLEDVLNASTIAELVNAERAKRRNHQEDLDRRQAEARQRKQQQEDARKARILAATVERDRLDRRHEMAGRINVAKRALTHTAAEVTFSAPSLGETDLRLILKWADQTPMGPVTMATVRSALPPAQLARLYSARSAELAVIDYFERRGATARDVAATQLQVNLEDWTTHDVSAEGIDIDVKNARQSASDPSRYSEYLVPRFKEDRAMRRDVAIAAVLSPYRTAERIESEHRGKSTMVGFATKTDLDGLASWLAAEFSGDLMVGNLCAGGRLPGWCFEYDAGHYPSWKHARRLIHEAADHWMANSDVQQAVRFPKPLIAFLDDEPLVRSLLSRPGTLQEIPSEQLTMWRQIASIRDTIGLSRRSLFAFVLAYTLQRLRDTSGRWSPTLFDQWLFFGSSPNDRSRPLGLDDPLGYLDGIVDAMKVLWEYARGRLVNYKSFRLANPWILRGTTADGVEETIMAYCGGWKTLHNGTRAKCGFSPLVLGSHLPCSKCHKLKCHDCGFCSERCPGERSVERPS